MSSAGVTEKDREGERSQGAERVLGLFEVSGWRFYSAMWRCLFFLINSFGIFSLATLIIVHDFHF
jgi:hypothetical protein